MSLQTTKEGPNFCRLCLSEEMLEDVFVIKQDDIICQISDLLSIVVSENDQISRSICAICRARLYEFHNYKLSCLEVQEVLQSQIWPAVENDLSAPDYTQVESDAQDDPNAEDDLLVEMKIKPENVNLDAEIFKTEEIEEPFKYGSIRQKEPRKPREVRKPYDIKKKYRTCRICRKPFLSSSLQAHLETHVKNYNCQRGCEDAKFDDLQTQLQHYVEVHHDNVFQCKICLDLCKSKSSLQYHRMKYHCLENHPCGICKRAYPSKFLLTRHIRLNHREKMRCPKCEYTSGNKFNFDRHMVTCMREIRGE